MSSPLPVSQCPSQVQSEFSPLKQIDRSWPISTMFWGSVDWGVLAFQSGHYMASMALDWNVASFSMGSLGKIEGKSCLKCPEMQFSNCSVSHFIKLKCLLSCNIEFASYDLEKSWTVALVNWEQMGLYVQTAREELILSTLKKSCLLPVSSKHPCWCT